jgi:hypothetical protein
MQSVKVRRSGISAGEAADVLLYQLGDGYEVEADGENVLLVRKGMARAKVSMRAESGGTVFDVSGEGTSVLPLFKLVTKLVNDNGIAKKTSTAIDEAVAFRDDS